MPRYKYYGNDECDYVLTDDPVYVFYMRYMITMYALYTVGTYQGHA